MSLIFLGVDPGSRATGYGLVAADGDQVYHIDSGFISLSPQLPHSRRLAKIYQRLEGLIRYPQTRRRGRGSRVSGPQCPKHHQARPGPGRRPSGRGSG